MKLHHCIRTHLRQHHKKYVGGLFAGFAIVKTFVLLVGALGIVQLGSTFAGGGPDTPPPPLALDSGNVTQFCQTDTTNCDLWDKGIISIAQDTFSNFTQLSSLSLGRNNISSLSSGELPSSITYLSLEYNNISSLANFDFSGLPNLNSLNIKGNNITSLSSGDLPTTLTYLDFQDNNISSLANFDFSGLPNLNSLNLGWNNITGLSNGELPTRISYLSLQGQAGITSLANFDFSFISGLVTLDLSRNNLTSLDSLNLQNISGIHQLNINNNLLTTLPEAIIGLSGLSSYTTGNNCPGCQDWVMIGLHVDNNCLDATSMSSGLVAFLDDKSAPGWADTYGFSCPLLQGILKQTYRGDKGALSGLIFSISADQAEVVSGDTINYTFHYENTSETIKHYGVMIRDYLPTTLDIISSSIPATYVDHDVVYGGEDDVCFQQFVQESTGAYYTLLDDTIFAAFGATALQAAQGMLGYTGDAAGVGAFFYDNMCLPAGRTNLNDCFIHQFDFGDTPQLSYPELLTVGSGCGVVGAPLAEPYYYRHIGYVGTGNSGDITISTQVNSTHSSGLIENFGEYYLNMVTQRTNNGDERGSILDGVRVTSVAPFECANAIDVSPAVCNELVALYNSTDGDNWSNNDGWLKSTTIGTWYGITVTDGHVTQINLGKNHLSGTLDAIGLGYLEYIILGQNNIAGSLDIFCGLANLNYLDISKNLFSGTIPACFTTGAFQGLLYNNYLDAIAFSVAVPPPELVAFDARFSGSSAEENWINQYSSVDLSLASSIRSLMGNRFSLDVSYTNKGSQAVRSGVLYYDIVDGVSISASEKVKLPDGNIEEKNVAFTTGIVGATYGEFGDPCLDEFYNEGTGKYLDAMNAFFDNKNTGLTLLTYLQSQLGFTGTEAEQGKAFYDYGISQSGGKSLYLLLKEDIGVDLATIPNCGTGGRAVYIFDLADIKPEAEVGTKQITIIGTLSGAATTDEFINHLELSSTDPLRSDPVTGNNTISEAFTYVEPVFDCSTVTDVTANDCEILVNFYNSTDGNNWTNHSGRLESTTVADWYGITGIGTAAGRSINLQANNLSGTADLRGLGKLTSIKLGYNQLSSVNVDGLSVLRSLNLNGNRLQNIDLGGLQSLQRLQLDGNQLSTIDLSGLPQLAQVRLGNNRLSGSLDVFCPFTGLTMLGLNNNLFSGDIPECLTGLTKMAGGKLDHNYLDYELVDEVLGGFLNQHFNGGDGWRSQRLPTDLSLTGDITSLSPASFVINLSHENIGPKTSYGATIYYDMVDGVSITTDRAYTTGIIDKTYAEFGDPCFDDLYNDGTGAYRDAIDAYLQQVSAGNLTLLSFIQTYVGFSGAQEDAGSPFVDYMIEQGRLTGDPDASFYDIMKASGFPDFATIKNCGTGGKSVYIFTLGTFYPDKGNYDGRIAVGSGGTLTITGTMIEGTNRFTNHLEILNTSNLRIDPATGNNTVSFRYGPGGDPVATEMSFLGEDNISQVTIFSGTTVVVNGGVWNRIATLSTKPYFGLPTNEIVKGTVSIDFGGAATFDRPIKIIIPVETDGNYYVLANHGAGLTTDGLTTFNNAATSCESGLVIPTASRYNGSAIASSGKLVTIYSCAASSFIAYTSATTPSTPTGPSGGPVLEKDLCAPADCSTSYYDRNCGGCPGDKLIELVVNTHGAAGMQCNRYSNELNIAYNFALDNNITTIADCDKVNLDGQLLRSHMAKMMSNFAMTTLGLKLDTGTVCTFTDMDKQSNEMKTYATLACQLGLMGRDADGKVSKMFNPNETVTRAQFGTVLSRLLRGEKNNGGTPYYAKHLQALKTVGIMTKIEIPNQKELRGFTMLMLQRIMSKAASTINSSDTARPVRQSVQEYFDK